MVGKSVKVDDFSKRIEDLPKPHFTVMSSAKESEIGIWEVEIENAAGPPENLNQAGHPENDPPQTNNPPPPLNPSFDDNAFPETIGITTEQLYSEKQDEDIQVEDEIVTSNIEESSNDHHFGFEDSPVVLNNDFSVENSPVPAENSFSSISYDQQPPMVPNYGTQNIEIDSIAVENDTIKKLNITLEERAASKDAEHEKLRTQMKEKAEEELEAIYEERTNRNAIKQASNRELQKETGDVENCSNCFWEKVLSLIPMQNEKKEIDESKARMRKLFINLKNDK